MRKMKMVSPTPAGSNVKVYALFKVCIEGSQFKENPQAISNQSEENCLLLIHINRKQVNTEKIMKYTAYRLVSKARNTCI